MSAGLKNARFAPCDISNKESIKVWQPSCMGCSTAASLSELSKLLRYALQLACKQHIEKGVSVLSMPWI
jgi:hypothetical protein